MWAWYVLINGLYVVLETVNRNQFDAELEVATRQRMRLPNLRGSLNYQKEVLNAAIDQANACAAKVVAL